MSIFECSICQKQFGTVSNRNRHEKTHEKPHKCTVCSESFGKQCQLRKHLLLHQQESTGEFKCTECDSVFKNYRQFHNHIKRHEESKTYSCEVCGESSPVFYKFSELVNHRRLLHLKAFKCPLCPSTFATEANLQQHADRKHPNGEPPSYPCNECGAVYTTKSNLISHVRVVHQNRLYTCPLCHQQFKWPGHLTRHVKKFHPRGELPVEGEVTADSNAVSCSGFDDDDGLSDDSLECSENGEGVNLERGSTGRPSLEARTPSCDENEAIAKKRGVGEMLGDVEASQLLSEVYAKRAKSESDIFSRVTLSIGEISNDNIIVDTADMLFS